jgi:phenylacetate-CoA ligase
MFIIRGNNVFPTAIESILRRFPEVAEFRVEAYDDAWLTQVRIDLEPAPDASDGTDLVHRVGHALQDALSFRAEIRTVSPGTLPRFEMKAKRFMKRVAQPDPSTTASKP